MGRVRPHQYRPRNGRTSSGPDHTPHLVNSSRGSSRGSYPSDPNGRMAYRASGRDLVNSSSRARGSYRDLVNSSSRGSYRYDPNERMTSGHAHASSYLVNSSRGCSTRGSYGYDPNGRMASGHYACASSYHLVNSSSRGSYGCNLPAIQQNIITVRHGLSLHMDLACILEVLHAVRCHIVAIHSHSDIGGHLSIAYIYRPSTICIPVWITMVFP